VSLTSVSSWPPAWLTPISDEMIQLGEGEDVIDFAEAFGIITKDSIAGKAGSPMDLRDWQAELLRNLFAHDEKGLKNRVSLVGMPRKNGKSSLMSVVAAYGLVGSSIRGAEVYSCAADKDQARLVFADTKKLIEASELSEMCKLYRDAIEVPETGSVYRVLSAEAYSKEGLSPTMVIFDELHAQPNRELFDVMALAQGARGNLATLIAITTAGVKSDSSGQDSIAYNLYQYGQKVARGEIDDPTFFMAWWEAPQEFDHTDPKTWELANPGFDDICAKSDFESAVLRTPESEFRRKRINNWVSSKDAWLPAGSWDQLAVPSDYTEDDEFIIGFDGSWSNDSTAVIGIRLPRHEDDKPHLFMIQTWEKQPDDDASWRVPTLEVEDVIIQFCTKYRNVREVVFDPPRWTKTMVMLEEMGFPVVGFPTFSAARIVPACQIFYDAVTEQTITHDGNPVLTRHLDNAVVKSDRFGRRITKESAGSPRKIDAAIAAVIALDRCINSTKLEDELSPQFFI
jgi:phage terminase large subunit-like protein